jgi:hypothetical protein
MQETKLISTFTIFLGIVFSIIGFYYIFNDIIKGIKRNKIEKIKERMMIENGEYKTIEIIPPSLFKIKNNNVEFTIDLDSVIGFSFESGEYIRFITATNDRNYTININDLNFIENTEELEFNNEFKILTEEFSFPRYNSLAPEPESKLSKHVEFEKLYNQLLKWKALRKLYLNAGKKATIYDYRFYSLIKNIKFIDVMESDVCKTLHQINYKTKTNSIYEISNLDNKQKEKKNEKLVYEEDQPI